ncbi:MAG: hypothetical protein JMDDDDMK_02012 [Acidobacteria bacterium]|nr:hypothetical protein [Acidobacteriota bacterium]
MFRPFRVNADDRECARFGQRLDRPDQSLRRSFARKPVVAVRVSLRRDLVQLLIELLAMLSGHPCGGAAMRGDGVNAYRINRAVNADGAGHPPDRFDRVFLIEVNHLGPLRARHFQPRLFGVNGEDAPRAQQMRAGDAEQSHRAAAEDRHSVAALDLGQLRAEISRRENVREHDRLLVAHLFRQLHQSGAGERDARVFGLQPVERA